MKHVFDIIEELRATSSKNEKIAIVKREANNKLFREVIYLALNPFITFGMTKIPKYVRRSKAGNLLDITTLMILRTTIVDRKITGHAARDWIIDLLSDMSEQDAAVIEMIIKKDFDAGFSESTVNKAWGDFIPTWPVMLCSPSGTMTFPAIAQLKEDGMRVNAICRGKNIQFTTRAGQVLDFGDTFDKMFSQMAGKDELVFDGEALVVDNNGTLLPRKESNGIVRKAQHGSITKDELSRIRFVLWDVISHKDFLKGKWMMVCKDRLSMLSERVASAPADVISVVPSQQVNSLEQAEELFQKYLSEGREGLIIKDPHGLWEDKRVRHQIKMKGENEADLVVTGVNPHSKNPKLIGSLICQTSDGKLITGVGSGLTDDDRKKPAEYWINKIVAVIYNELIQDKKGGVVSMFLPRYVEVRTDKKVANTLQELK